MNQVTSVSFQPSTKIVWPRSLLTVFSCAFLGLAGLAAQPSAMPPEIRTPAPSAAPRINGPTIVGVRPGAPFLYAIPATGVRPMQFAAENLPAGLALDPATGHIMGILTKPGRCEVTLQARNAEGVAQRKLRIEAGERIALTPAMGWNSWNCWAGAVDQEKVLRSGRAMVASGLAQHGWTYINIDDTWQGGRGGKDRALQSNGKFPDMKALCDTLHGMGLKAGIYSTPWITSYAKFAGGSSDDPAGRWSRDLANESGYRLGKYSFAEADAKQWAAWGFDYLKYDWAPNDVPQIEAMSRALRQSGRDIVFSLSNTAPFAIAADLARLANSWRTTCDIWDSWAESGQPWQYGVSEIAFAQERWAGFAGPGHWNDPDMLVVGYVGWGPQLHATRLSPDEQYTHLTMWCMLSAPLLIGCDLERLDAFTLNLLTNDEVLAVDQDALGRQAVRVATRGAVDVYLKDLEDGSKAIAFFNRDSLPQTLAFNKLPFLGLGPGLHVRDLWRNRDLPDLADTGKKPWMITIAAHGVELYRLINPN